MDVFLYSFNGIAPIFSVILIGMLINKLGFFSEKTKQEIIKLIFYVGTPALLFKSVASAELYSLFNFNFILFIWTMIAVLIVFSIIACLIIKDKLKKAAVIQIAFRSNIAIIGLPLAKSLLDSQGVAKMAVAMPFAVILFNVLAVAILSYYTEKKQKISSVILSIIKNPLIISTFSGLIFAFFKIPIPTFISGTLDIIGETAASMGLLILGATITITGLKENKLPITIAVFLRNFFSPFLFLTAGALLGFRGDEMIILAIISSAPAAINCFVMAKQMGADADISAFGVSFTSIFSIISVFTSIYLLKILCLA